MARKTKLNVVMTFKELSEITGVNEMTLRMRYNKGLRGKELAEPADGRDIIYVDTEFGKLTLQELSERTGIAYKTLWGRYIRGVKNEDIMRPVNRNSKLSQYLQMLSEQSGISIELLRTRYRQGKRDYELIEPVIHRPYVTIRKGKPVIKYDLDGNVIAEYESVKDCVRDCDVSSTTVRFILKGKSKGKGYTLKYKFE